MAAGWIGWQERRLSVEAMITSPDLYGSRSAGLWFRSDGEIGTLKLPQGHAMQM